MGLAQVIQQVINNKGDGSQKIQEALGNIERNVRNQPQQTQTAFSKVAQRIAGTGQQQQQQEAPAKAAQPTVTSGKEESGTKSKKADKQAEKASEDERTKLSDQVAAPDTQTTDAGAAEENEGSKGVQAGAGELKPNVSEIMHRVGAVQPKTDAFDEGNVEFNVDASDLAKGASVTEEDVESLLNQPGMQSFNEGNVKLPEKLFADSDSSMPIPNVASSTIDPKDALSLGLMLDGYTPDEAKWLSQVNENPDMLRYGSGEIYRDQVNDILNKYTHPGNTQGDSTKGDNANTMNEGERKAFNNIADDVRAESEAQAFLLENRNPETGALPTNGSYEWNKLLSQDLRDDDKNLMDLSRSDQKAIPLSAENLEDMSDIELVDAMMQMNPEYRDYMTKTYGDMWSGDNAFDNDYLVLNEGQGKGDKEAITRDLFLNDMIDPVIQAQLLQRVINTSDNPDIAKMSDDDKVQAILSNYFDNPVDVEQWLQNPKYQEQNVLPGWQAALWGAQLGNELGANGILDQTGLNINDVAARVLAGNELYRDQFENASDYDVNLMSSLLQGSMPNRDFAFTNADGINGYRLGREYTENGVKNDTRFAPTEGIDLSNASFIAALMNAMDNGTAAQNPVDYLPDEYFGRIEKANAPSEKEAEKGIHGKRIGVFEDAQGGDK